MRGVIFGSGVDLLLGGEWGTGVACPGACGEGALSSFQDQLVYLSKC